MTERERERTVGKRSRGDERNGERRRGRETRESPAGKRGDGGDAMTEGVGRDSAVISEREGACGCEASAMLDGPACWILLCASPSLSHPPSLCVSLSLLLCVSLPFPDIFPSCRPVVAVVVIIVVVVVVASSSTRRLSRSPFLLSPSLCCPLLVFLSLAVCASRSNRDASIPRPGVARTPRRSREGSFRRRPTRRQADTPL